MTQWKCSSCGYSLSAQAPPKSCPGCNKTCEFQNITCYIPECQGSGSDQRL